MVRLEEPGAIEITASSLCDCCSNCCHFIASILMAGYNQPSMLGGVGVKNKK